LRRGAWSRADLPPELFKDADDCDLVVRALAGLSERCRE
jgi:hypothetical protein